MKAVEMHYTPAEVALLLRLCTKTVIQKMKSKEFGERIANVGSEERPDYRIPAEGINAYLERRKVFTEPGVAARTTGELRRKVACSPDV